MHFLTRNIYIHHTFNKKVAFLFSVVNKYHQEIKIGNVTKGLDSPKNPYLVPTGYLTENLSQNVLQHLQWIMKKDILKQDIFLIGVPGPLRGRIILQYLELCRREVEYVVLSRDTTENDLKQRREIFNGTAHYVDQSAVNAAIEGRFLILDGVEKVERNVLPVLNNLLENREMQLEDGRFLIAPERYDKLLSEHSKKILDSWKLVRVSENFRVVALGLPVPPFKGNPLDPPFRSRFQARNVSTNFDDYLPEIDSLSNVSSPKVFKNFLSACFAFHSNESENLGLPKFPIENISLATKIAKNTPNVPFELMFRWMYPYNLILSKDGQKQVLDTLKMFSIKPEYSKASFKIKKDKPDNCFTHSVEISRQNKKNVCDILGHRNGSKELLKFVPNDYHVNVLTDMINTHAVHDFCLIGNKGSGKSVLIRKFASILNYPIEMVMLYADMTARDLLQQRITDDKGNTLWRPSQLVNSAKDGKLLVLDGLHRLHSSTLSVLQRLIHNREMQLFDGMRLIHSDRYDKIKRENNFSDEDMEERKILKIHPSFRIVALAETPKIKTSKKQWLTPEVMSMFLFHSLRPLSLEEEKRVIKSTVGTENTKVDIILNFAHKLRSSDDETLLSVSGSFSTRQLIRLAQRISEFPDVSVYTLLTQACLLKFLPQITKQAVENILESCGITNSDIRREKKVIYIENDKVFIGNTSISIYDPGDKKVKVPNILFYDNQEHIEVMEAMLQDFILGEHLLLVGNQGVGKNKITDRFIQLLNRPREYIQLHRDTTVQSLTQQPTVVDGKIVYEDSPLLRAVQHGHVLIVDEADKAPTHVTSILKALVESGEMVLSDGRCIVHHSDEKFKNDPSKIIMHPDFRMIVLANRPGFPFLGNDFFATLGDIFSCHAVDNPTLESEISMLLQYAPNVSVDVLKKLAKLFGELRKMSDSGLISYPYSTREIVNVAKHIEKFPGERISQALKNVFDFDSFSSDIKNTISNLFSKYGIPFESETIKIDTAKFYDLPKLSLKSHWEFLNGYKTWQAEAFKLIYEDEHVWPVKVHKLDVIETRGSTFSEQLNYCKMIIKDNDIPLSIDSTQSEDCNIQYIATANPISVHIVDQDKSEQKTIKLPGYFPTIRSGFKPCIKMSVLSLSNEENLFFHESMSNQFFIMNVSRGLVKRINITSILENTISKITTAVYSKSVPKTEYKFLNFPSRKKVIIFKLNSNKLMLLDFDSEKLYKLNTQDNIQHISVLDENVMFLALKEQQFVADIHNPLQWQVREINMKDMPLNYTDLTMRNININPSSKLPTEMKETSTTLMLNSDDYASFILRSLITDQSLNVYSIPRMQAVSVGHKNSCILPNSNIIVKLLHSRDLPKMVKDTFTSEKSGFIEVVNLKELTYGYIDVSLPLKPSAIASWFADTSENYLQMCVCPNEELVTIDLNGYLRRWQIDKKNLESSFAQWQNELGLRNESQLSVEFSNPNSAIGPKHGKVDPTGSPHVGGNTWAGGTGGRDTAGLGGKGGPYRLDAGYKVFQLPDSEKQAVPPEIREAARKMAKKAYKDKLREIDMSEYDAEIYESFLDNVKKQINILRVILDGLQAKSKERQWMKNQTSGELDDSKLIESITGEKTVYKKRGEQEPEIGSPQEKPKLLRLVVDVSGSMYRFNGLDNRLQRQIESIVLVMEAFDGYEEKFKYEIIGHSGEEFNIQFSPFKNPPKNNKEKLDVIKKMYAHSQFCMSGDNTLPATDHAIKTITDEDADEYFVVILSDANFDRYGISPVEFNNILISNPKVNAFSIFIGSLGNEANILLKQIPAGRAFMCFDSANITQILQKIFTSTLLRD